MRTVVALLWLLGLLNAAAATVATAAGVPWAAAAGALAVAMAATLLAVAWAGHAQRARPPRRATR